MYASWALQTWVKYSRPGFCTSGFISTMNVLLVLICKGIHLWSMSFCKNSGHLKLLKSPPLVWCQRTLPQINKKWNVCTYRIIYLWKVCCYSFDKLVHSRRTDFQACKCKADSEVTVSNKVNYLILWKHFEEILVHVLDFWVPHPCASLLTMEMSHQHKMMQQDKAVLD